MRSRIITNDKLFTLNVDSWEQQLFHLKFGGTALKMAAARSFGSPVFVAFIVLFCHLIFSDLNQQLTKITGRPFMENQTPPSSCSERKVVIQLGHLGHKSLFGKARIPKISCGFFKMVEAWPDNVTSGWTRPTHRHCYLLRCAYESWPTIRE